MVPMTKVATPSSAAHWRSLSQLVRRVDEDRWISSRYAPAGSRRTLISLYAYYYELSKIRITVSEPALGAIRFQWWRDTLDEIEARAMIRAHDVAKALAELIIAGEIGLLVARRLLDAHQAAFEANDRSLEPEGLLMSAAANTLTSTHAWGPQIADLAAAYAAARRGASRSRGPILPKIPSNIRPAVAHARLRAAYAAGKEPGPLAKRAIIMRAVISGRV